MAEPKSIKQQFEELSELHPEWGNEKRLAQAVLLFNRKMAEAGERDEVTKEEEEFFEGLG